MKPRRKKRNKNNGAPKWMVTYSDMITLVLVFFVLLFSMSQIDQTRFEALAESFQNRMVLDFLPSAIPMEHPSESPDINDNNDEDMSGELEPPEEPKEGLGEQEDEGEPQLEERLENLLDQIEVYLSENDLGNLVSANRSEVGVSLVLQESILFDTGEALILKDGVELLDEIASLLSDIPNNVRVEGHTDSRPISNFRYPSNWELSGARASSVVRYFIDEKHLDGERFSSVGYAETRPLVENTPENWSKNRRVEIVILDSRISDDEMIN